MKILANPKNYIPFIIDCPGCQAKLETDLANDWQRHINKQWGDDYISCKCIVCDYYMMIYKEMALSAPHHISKENYQKVPFYNLPF